MERKRLPITICVGGGTFNIRWILAVLALAVGMGACSRKPEAQTEQFKARVEEYATIESITGGVPVWSFSNLAYIYGTTPDLLPGVVMQEGNQHPRVKIEIKKSWEIKSNFAGAESEMTRRSAWNDSQPMLPIHLIDGDPNTAWASFEMLAAEARSEWIRVDLPMEAVVASVVLLTADYRNSSYGNYGKALPKYLEVKTGRDALHWETVYTSKQVVQNQPRLEIKFTPRPAKQVWIIGNNFPNMGTYDQSRYAFSLGEVEVRDPAGVNRALVSRGGSVTVSSTSYVMLNDRFTQDALWNSLNYDLGNKWVRIGGDNGSFMWHYVEHEKGKLEMDPVGDRSVTELVQHGIQVILNLDFKGNWIYERPARKTDWLDARFREINDSYNDPLPAADNNPEMYQGYLRYLEYMARRFKDRVSYFELGNEWNAWFGAEHYVKTFLKPALDTVRRVAPNAKIMLGSPAGFDADVILDCLGAQRTTGISEGRLSLDPKGVQPSGIGIYAPPERKLGAVAFRTDLSVSDAAVSADFENQGEPGIVLRYVDQKNYVAASYSSVAHSIAIQEVVNASACGSVCGAFGTNTSLNVERKVGNLGSNIKLAARVESGIVLFTVTDGMRSVSTQYKVRFLEKPGALGVFQRYGERPQHVSHFKVTESDGRILAADDFRGPDGSIPANWKYAAGGPNPIEPGLASQLDAIAWHPGPNDGAYFTSVRKFQQQCRELGFKGQFLPPKSMPAPCTRQALRGAHPRQKWPSFF